MERLFCFALFCFFSYLLWIEGSRIFVLSRCIYKELEYLNFLYGFGFLRHSNWKVKSLAFWRFYYLLFSRFNVVISYRLFISFFCIFFFILEDPWKYFRHRCKEAMSVKFTPVVREKSQLNRDFYFQNNLFVVLDSLRLLLYPYNFLLFL